MNRDELAHELWAAAQLAPGEGISDAVARMNSLLAAQPAEAEGVDVVAWAYSGTLSVLEITREGSCLLTVDAQEGQDTPLVRQSDHLAALSAVTAERDALREQVKDLQSDANSWQSGYDKGRHDGTKHRKSEIDQLRAEVETLRKDAERYRWASSGVHEAETLVSIVNCHGGYAEKVAERVDVYRDAAMAAKEA